VPNAFYCPFDRTIYLVPQFLVDLERQFGDYAPITVLSHEWGHHVQALLGIEGPTRKDFELQADCLMGVFTRHADDQGLLDYGDFMEALSISQDAGDPIYLPEDAPGAHGQSEDRVKALTRGYGGGPVTGCKLPLAEERAVLPTVGVSTSPSPDLPLSLPLAHAGCFHVVGDGTLTFDQLLGRFSGIENAATRLQGLGWRSSVFRTFACDGPPSGAAGWIDISLHEFASAASAQQAVDFFAAARAEGTLLSTAAAPPLGDYATALAGPASNGEEFTVYASRGPLLVRVTGVSPTGMPFADVLAVTQEVIDSQERGTPSGATMSPPSQVFPASAYLPSSLEVSYADCFQILDRGNYSYNDVVQVLEQVGLTSVEADGLGWKDGAYIVFSCTHPPHGRASQIDVVIHQFYDAPMALSYFDRMRVLGENESRACDTARSLVICVYGRSDDGSPLSDVHFVLNQVVEAAR
jgi:hypothetical protein